MKLQLPFLETMITQVCNISCHGCTNYSDLPSTGYVPWQQGQQQLEPWLEILSIPDFGIIGGEPLINPEALAWIVGVRQLLPNSQIRFTTNGLLLHKHPDLFRVFQDIGNCVFKITVHHSTEFLENYIQDLTNNHNWDWINEHGITRRINRNGVRFQINRPDVFLKTYRGEYRDMMPHHSVPEQAFDICIQKTCPLLHDSKIYKCSTAGLLKNTLGKLNNPNIDHWRPYIDSGISVNDSQQEIIEFVDNFAQPNKICAQCPTALDQESRIPHQQFISFGNTSKPGIR